MRKESKRKLKNFTMEVIDFFLGVPESFINAFDRKEFYRIVGGMPSEKALTCSKIGHLISNMKRNGYIEVLKNETKQSIKFTNKAKLAIVDRLSEKSDVDGNLRFVSFDIPETSRIKRNRFRRAIKRMGFVQVQKSLWVCNKNIGDMVELAAIEYGVDDYVVYIASNNCNIDAALKKLL